MSRSLTITIATVILVLAAAIVTVIVLLPKYAARGALVDRVRMLESTLAERQALLEKARRETIQIPSEVRSRLALFLPSGNEAPSLVATIDALSARHGVVVSSITFTKGGAVNDPASPPPIADELSAALSIEGSYRSLYRFLESLERNIRLIDINKLAMGMREGAEVMTMELNVTAYYQKPSALNP